MGRTFQWVVLFVLSAVDGVKEPLVRRLTESACASGALPSTFAADDWVTGSVSDHARNAKTTGYGRTGQYLAFKSNMCELRGSNCPAGHILQPFSISAGQKLCAPCKPGFFVRRLFRLRPHQPLNPCAEAVQSLGALLGPSQLARLAQGAEGSGGRRAWGG